MMPMDEKEGQRLKNNTKKVAWKNRNRLLQRNRKNGCKKLRKAGKPFQTKRINTDFDWRLPQLGILE